jgi:branched-chain amino acid transport system permease protein
VKDFFQFFVAGVASGALYALVALGFVVIYKATGVINFAQGALVLLGAYVTYGFAQELNVPFYLAVLLAMVTCAAVGFLVERLVLRRMVGQPVFAVIMITVGLSIAVEQVVTWKWGFDRLEIGDPWGNDTVRFFGAVLAVTDIVRIVLAGLFLLGFFLFFTRSRMGVAMRATASDQEAALAQGISARRVFALSWAIAGAVATVAGVLLVSGTRGMEPTLSVVALLAFPAIILGGLDSPLGAIVGGVIIGLVEVMTAAYGPRYLPEWVGTNFHTVTPYVVLVGLLLVRPYGLFGTREVTRV